MTQNHQHDYIRKSRAESRLRGPICVDVIFQALPEWGESVQQYYARKHRALPEGAPCGAFCPAHNMQTPRPRWMEGRR
jgi:hypothetical protein